MRLAARNPGLKRVLVVDDDEDVRVGLARAIERRGGYATDTAADAFQAGYKLATFQPHLVVLDIVMPGLSGLEICDRIRALSPEEIKVIVLTGFPSRGHKLDTLIRGGDLFLVKPQDVESLLEHIDDLLGA